RIPRDSEKTADFGVFSGDRRLFIGEVKNLNCHDVPTHVVPGTRPEDVALLGAMRDDNGPMRVSRVIVKGAEQLANYQGVKVLFIVNDEHLMAFKEDFCAGFRGHEEVGPSFDGGRALSYLAAAPVLKQLETARDVIDLYVWIEAHVNPGERDL